MIVSVACRAISATPVPAASAAPTTVRVISAEVSAAEPVSRAAPLRPYAAPPAEPGCGRSEAGRAPCAPPPERAGLRAGLALLAAGLRAGVLREAAGLRDDVLRDALARDAVLRAAPRAPAFLRVVRFAEDFEALDLRAPPAALRAPADPLRVAVAPLRAPVDPLRELATDLRAEAAGLRFAAVLRPPDLLALLLREAVRRPAVLPRLLEREPVVRAMVRHSIALRPNDRPI
jgi:hypothetical protein